jgi:hypothetical protein
MKGGCSSSSWTPSQPYSRIGDEPVEAALPVADGSKDEPKVGEVRHLAAAFE